MRPTSTGRNGSRNKIYQEPKRVRRYFKYIKQEWNMGLGLPPRSFVKKRMQKLWHARLRRAGKEQISEHTSEHTAL